MKPPKVPPPAAEVIAQSVASAPRGLRVAIVDSAARHFGCSRASVYRAIAAAPTAAGIRGALEVAEREAARLRALADKTERKAQDAEREAAELRELAREHNDSDTTQEGAA